MKLSNAGAAILCGAMTLAACNRSNENTETTPQSGSSVTSPETGTETGAAEEDRETGGQTPSGATGTTDNDSTSDAPAGGPGSGPGPGSRAPTDLEEGGDWKGSFSRSHARLAVDDRRFIAMNVDPLQSSGGSWGAGGRSGTGGARSGPGNAQGGAAR